MSVLVLAALALAQEAATEPQIDGPLEWAMERAPHGIDITLDGKLWINSNKVGAKDDYAILATDLHRAVTSKSIKPRLWVRGYHRRNPSVNYRESKLLVVIDCTRDTLRIEKRIAYSADGGIVETGGPYRSDPIVPGTNGEAWRKMACSWQ
ncbi:hypothetical protein H9L12_08320 [Sphingomonas rhizophila]|uniref:Uncharacterized protein n=1 Tax=Sphingomonas rhizophila TaxID=2071607 RepID=A0A7G9S911_9SPHN|nr:hypothetical protein [Sphingomonas rhizophila]QNN64336.1 hypothetical protein H9L12_08320 [Sphingomonas rhizophila]